MWLFVGAVILGDRVGWILRLLRGCTGATDWVPICLLLDSTARLDGKMSSQTPVSEVGPCCGQADTCARVQAAPPREESAQKLPEHMCMPRLPVFSVVTLTHSSVPLSLLMAV